MKFLGVKKLLYPALVLVVFLGFAEGMLRIANWPPAAVFKVKNVFEMDLFEGDSLVEGLEGEGRPIIRVHPALSLILGDQAIPLEKTERTFRIFSFGGSTTHGNPYGPAASFSAFLREGLSAAFPHMEFQLINMGGDALSSSHMVRFARDAGRVQPDCLLVYCGHNEMVDIFIPRIRQRMKMGEREAWGVKNLRLFQLAAFLSKSVPGGKPPSLAESVINSFESWYNFYQVILEYAPDREDVSRVIENYRKNIAEVARTARQCKCLLLLVLPLRNYRDSFPGLSRHSESFRQEDASRWNVLFQRGCASMEEGRLEEALEAFRETLGLDKGYAEVHFRMGRVLEGLGRMKEAKEAYLRAADFECFPTSRRFEDVLKILRETVREPGVLLVDVEPIFEERSRNGLVGGELFWDGFHPNLEGHGIIARGIFETLLAAGGKFAEAGGERERFAGALDRYISNLALQPEVPLIKAIDRSFEFVCKRNIPMAERVLEEAVKEYPDSALTYVLAAYLYMKMGKPDKVPPVLERALSIDPGEPLLQRYLKEQKKS